MGPRGEGGDAGNPLQRRAAYKPAVLCVLAPMAGAACCWGGRGGRRPGVGSGEQVWTSARRTPHPRGAGGGGRARCGLGSVGVKPSVTPRQ